jgi:hypothetical protein
MAQVEQRLDFAETVMEKFNAGDPRLRKDICMDIGWNWVLQGKKLTFTRHNWFFDLENLKNHYEREKEQLEPVKTFEEYRETDSFKAVRPILSSLRDNIRADKPKE